MTGFKEHTRIANYTGLPELMSMFKQVADIRTADTLKLDVPDCDYQVVQVEATPFQQELVQELADRADAINSGNVDPTIDNMRERDVTATNHEENVTKAVADV